MVTFGGCEIACVCVHILIHGSMTTTEIPLMTAHATTRTMTTAGELLWQSGRGIGTQREEDGPREKETQVHVRRKVT